MIDYINNVIGINASEHDWEDGKNLPVYLKQGKKYSILSILDSKCLVIKMESEKFNLSSFQKQIQQLKKYCVYPIVLCFEIMTAYQRKALIEYKIPFIVPGSQLYMPFLGIVLKEYYQSIPIKAEKLTPMAQYILLYILYNSNGGKYSQNELAAMLDISAMNVSRSVQELELLELVDITKTGRLSYVSLKENNRQTYENSEEYLQNPVQKKIYVRSNNVYESFTVAGEEALATISMLNLPNSKVRAIDKKRIGIIAKEDIVDPNWEMDKNIIEIELWKYNPVVLSKENRVDTISLILSLKDIDDERISMELNALKEEIAW